MGVISSKKCTWEGVRDVCNFVLKKYNSSLHIIEDPVKEIFDNKLSKAVDTCIILLAVNAVRYDVDYYIVLVNAWKQLTTKGYIKRRKK
jgi:hypothetical protein